MVGIASMADIMAVEAHGLPADLPASTYEVLRRGCGINPAAPAISFFLTPETHAKPHVVTHGTLFARVTQAANLFASLGLAPHETVAFLLPNLPETHYAIWGGEAAGVVAALNPLLEPAALVELLNASEARILVALAPFPGSDIWEKAAASVPHVPGLRHVVAVTLSHYLPGAPAEATIVDALRPDIPGSIGLTGFADGLAGQPTDRLVSGREIAPGDFSSMFCTGGTTGVPKLAMRRHRNEVTNCWMANAVLGELPGQSKPIFCGLPLFHVNGVMVTGLNPWSLGGHVVIGTPQGYRAPGLIHRFWEIVAHHRIARFSGVPTLYGALLAVPMDGHDVSCLEFGVCGAAPMPVALFQKFQEVTGVRILEGYGLTEGTCVSSINPPEGERRVGTIGLRLPLQKMAALILDTDGQYVREAEPNEVGVIAISGPNVFAGYKIESQNAGLWIDGPDGTRWMNTGDLGRRDADGYFTLTGRRKELIIRGGHNIDPGMIEEAIARHPAVQVVAAVGRPDPHAGELPVAYVQLRAGMQATEAELVAHAASAIPERAAVPKTVHILDAMPLTGVGKIFKPELKRREIADAVAHLLAEAGVPAVTVTSHDDPGAGTVVRIALASGTEPAAARAALTALPLTFNISVEP